MVRNIAPYNGSLWTGEIGSIVIIVIIIIIVTVGCSVVQAGLSVPIGVIGREGNRLYQYRYRYCEVKLTVVFVDFVNVKNEKIVLAKRCR